MRQLLTAFHIWRKEPSAPRKTTSSRLAWNSVWFNFTEQAQQIRRENRAIAVTKQQSSFIQQKLGPTTKLLILFSTQLHVVNQEYHSQFTRGYKYLFQSSFLTIYIPVFLTLTVQSTYCSGWQLFMENQAAVVRPLVDSMEPMAPPLFQLWTGLGFLTWKKRVWWCFKHQSGFSGKVSKREKCCSVKAANSN